MEGMELLWLGLLVAFLIAEGMTAAVTTIWFAAGALAALITAQAGGQLWLQITLFLAVSVICLLSLRPLLKKYVNPKQVKTNMDAVIGKQGIVLEEISNLDGLGRVKLGGMEWSARSSGGEKIPKGAVITVDKIEGVRVFVTPVKEKV